LRGSWILAAAILASSLAFIIDGTVVNVALGRAGVRNFATVARSDEMQFSK
jgi:hypothetical protein